MKISNDETVGEYLTRTRTLIKSKIRSGAMWHSEFDKVDAYHVCSRFLQTRLKFKMLRRVSQFKSYKVFFNHIKDKWKQSKDDFAEQMKTQSTPTEVNKAYIWNETAQENQAEADILAKVINVYHRYRRIPAQHGYWTPGPRPQGVRTPFRGD